MKTKVCIKCKQEQPFDYFVNDKNRPDGKFPYCKTCTSTKPERFIEKYADKLEGVKKCPDCGKKYPYSEFYKNAGDSRGMSSQCKKCMMKRRKIWEVANPDIHFDKRRNYGLKKSYGITIQDYEKMFKEQNGVCAICGSDNSGTLRSKHLFVDHNHITGGFTDSGIDYDFLYNFKNWMCFCSKRQLLDLIKATENCDNWNLITWAKPNPVPTCNNKYLPDSEYIIHGWKSGNLHGKYEDKQSFYIEKFGDRYSSHPNEKPLHLIKKLIILSSNKGNTIFDPFMGSGTTGAACMQLGRKFIGCELDPAYFAIAEKRIKAAASQEIMF